MKYFLFMMFMAVPVIETPAMAQNIYDDSWYQPGGYSRYDNGVDEGQLANERMENEVREQQYQDEIREQQRELDQRNAETPAERFTSEFGDCRTCR